MNDYDERLTIKVYDLAKIGRISLFKPPLKFT
jgi:hypothetical protein